jgi:hypothetical protein
MKICGTVRRPVVSIMWARASGSVSMRISSIWATPLEVSNCLARMQYGQTAVVYILTVGMTGSPEGLGQQLGFGNRQVSFFPSFQPAVQ